jgi:hypothetical protein
MSAADQKDTESEDEVEKVGSRAPAVLHLLR